MKAGKKIVIVEDDYAIREVIQLILQDACHELIFIEDNHKIVSTITQTPPDLVLLDLHFQGIDMKEIIKNLKEEKKVARIPIILVSADSEIAEIAKATGADNYLKKPFSIEDLEKVVENA